MRIPKPGTARLASGERGIAMVEFAIVLPVILLIMFGVTELGNAILRYNTLTKAVQDGARHASANALLGTTGSVRIDAQLEAEIANLVAYGNIAGTGTPILAGFTPGQVVISVPGPEQIRVVATYPYVPGFGVTLPTFGAGTGPSLAVDLTASVTMRAL